MKNLLQCAQVRPDAKLRAFLLEVAIPADLPVVLSSGN
jgi:hypothetical protein